MPKLNRMMQCRYEKCRNRFIPTRRWQKFCSSECKDHYWSEIRREVAAVIVKRKVKAKLFYQNGPMRDSRS